MKLQLRKILCPAWLHAGILLFAASVSLYGQRTVTGTVTDAADGQGVPGANVVIKGTTAGAITDLEGNYTITVEGADDILVFSYIGYLTQEIAVGAQTAIDVALQEDIQALDEVVVIGYGTVKKEDLTGSVAVVSAEDLNKVPSSSLARAIQGRASGVLVTQSGSPGSGPTIRIRGIGSINSSPNPLYIIDGVRAGGLGGLNTNDIETFQVLKDASAAAIYGADGANGVVIVTTKRGSAGKPKVTFSAYGSMNLVPEQFGVMNADQYAAFYNEIYEDNGLLPNVAYSDRFRQLYYGDGWEEGTEWQNAVTRRAYTQDYYLGVSGGNETSNYAISANYVDEQGILVSSASRGLRLRANSDFKIGDYLRVGESIQLSRGVTSVPNEWQSGAWSTPLITSPLMAIYNEDNKGGFDGPQIPFEFIDGGDTIQALNTGGNDKPNPLAPMIIGDDQRTGTGVTGSVYLEFTPFEWMTIRTMPSATYSANHNRNWFPSFESGVRTKSESTLAEDFNDNLALNMENRITLSKDFSGHRFTLTGVQDARKFEGWSSNVDDRGFEYENLNTIGNGNADLLQARGYYTPIRWSSYLARLIYDYESKYLVTASIRRDGNSRFGPGNRWGTFPSASAAWKLNEDLLPNVDAIDMLKVRVGYGQTGNSEIGNFRYEAQLSSMTDFSPVFGTSQQVAPAINVLNNFGNELIQWESSEMTNIGADIALLRNKFSATVEYYIKDTDNLVVRRSVSDVFGRIGTPFVNLGNIRNQGFEFNLSYRDMEGDFNYEITGMLTTIKNRVVDIPETYFDGNNVARVGNTVGSLRGFIAERIITPEDFDGEGNYLYAVPSNGVPSPGDLKFTDLNLDGVINDDDRTIIGKPIPDFIYSLNVNLYYRMFDFSMYWYGSQNVDVINSQRAQVESFVSQDINHNKTVEYSQNYYREDRPSTEFVRADLANSNDNTRTSTWWLEDASFLRMKDIQLGVTLPMRVAQTLGMTRARIYVSGVNLITITQYKGRDPEAPTSGNPLGIGTDGGSYPLPRIWTAGIQVDF